jgi:hypothetical protein
MDNGEADISSTDTVSTLVKNRVKTDCLLNSGHGVLN